MVENASQRGLGTKSPEIDNSSSRSSSAREPGWQLEGDSAAAYERYLVPAIFRACAAGLVALASPAPGGRVLDVACGTGIVARTAAPRVGRGGRVVGLDVNPAMLAEARRAAAGLGPEVEAIEWREGEATALPFPDASFDVVYCEQGLQFFGDRALALAEMRRVTAPDGRLALSVCHGLDRVPGYTALSDALERHAGPEAGTMMRSPFALGDGEALRGLVAGAGFREVRRRLEVVAVRYPSAEQLLWQEAASSPLAGPLGRLDGGARGALMAAVAGAMRPYTDDDGVMIPLVYHVVYGRR